MSDNRYRNCTVKIENGSGCIVQPLNSSSTYIFTAKHVINNKDTSNLRIVLRKLNELGNIDEIKIEGIINIYKHSDPEKDAAIIEINKFDNSVCLSTSNIQKQNSYTLCGFPENRKDYDDGYKEVVINTRNPVVYNYFEAATIESIALIKEDINGFSGGSILKSNDDEILLVGIQSKMAAKNSEETHGRIRIMPISFFSEIIQSYNLAEISNKEDSATQFQYIKPKSKYAVRFERLKTEVSNEVRYQGVLDELEFYLTKMDSIGITQKLIDGGFTQNEIIKATRRKEKYAKKAQKNRFYESAQRIDIDLFAKMIIDFETYVEQPLINNGADKSVILKALLEKVVNPILNILNEEGADDEILNYNAEDIYGMIYFLTGKCHLNWKNYDNL
jgi:hypothetical protein